MIVKYRNNAQHCSLVTEHQSLTETLKVTEGCLGQQRSDGGGWATTHM